MDNHNKDKNELENNLDISKYKYDIDTTEGDDDYTLVNIGPSHPALHGTLRLKAVLDGERFVACEPEIGFLHSGFEKIGEHHTYNQYIVTTDRMNYLSPLNNNIGYAHAVEELMGIEVPKRAKYIRTILAELGRISDHMLCQAFFGLDLGAFTAFLWGFVERERLYDVIEFATGTRLTTSFTRIGGLPMDIPEGFEKRTLEVCDKVEHGVKEIEKLFNKNKIFLDRITDVGYLSKEDALNFGASGPVLRASGVEYDNRIHRPYDAYSELDFNIASNNYCDCYGRYLVRFAEVRESIKIIRQAIEKMPQGPVRYENQKNALPDKQSTYNDMESLIHHFKNMMIGDNHGINKTKNEFYSCTESPNGELGWHIISDGKSSAYRIRVRPPSFFHFQLVPHIIIGHNFSDVTPIVGSLNIIAGELDR